MTGPLPPFTRAVLVASVLLFVMQGLLPVASVVPFMLWPLGEFPAGYLEGELVTVGFLPWQLLTYGFLHGSPAHLLFNLLAVYMFGGPLEELWGSRRQAWYYLACVAGAGLVQLGVATWSVQSAGEVYPTVGASGGVFGLLVAYGMLFPNQRVMLLFPPIPMKAWVLAVGYGVLELLLGLTGAQPGVAHFAHLGGMAAGFLIVQYWRGRWPFGRRRPG